MSFVYIWEYDVLPEREADFVAAYGSGGEWVRLFETAPGYVHTQLLRDREHPLRFVTIDRWRSEEDFRAFRKMHARAFESIDRACESFTRAERAIGDFELER